MKAEEIKALDDFTKKFAQEAFAFEAQHGYLNGGFVTGVFRKLASDYASQQRTEGIKEGFEAARERSFAINTEHDVISNAEILQIDCHNFINEIRSKSNVSYQDAFNTWLFKCLSDMQLRVINLETVNGIDMVKYPTVDDYLNREK